MPNSHGAVGQTADQGPLRRGADIEIGVLQTEGQAPKPMPEGEEKDARHHPVREVPQKIPKPRISVAQRQNEAWPGGGHVRPTCAQMPQIRRHQVAERALQTQEARRAQKDIPQRGHGID